jgi:hypothetical protein
MRYVFVFIVALFLLIASNTSNAQVRLGINFNLTNQPAWGPTGYDYVENYYFPDIEAYYNVPSHRYYYNERGRWISSASLPARFHFDLYNSHKEVINERQPWRNHNSYRDKYSSFKGQHDQQPIRDSKDSKYFANKNHPEHNNWVQQQKHGNNKSLDLNRGNNGHDNKANKQNDKRNEKDDRKDRK